MRLNIATSARSSRLLLVFCLCSAVGAAQVAGQDSSSANDSAVELDALVNSSINELIAAVEEDGAWPYEGVYRVRREIPVGYRVGGTAIVCEALLYLADEEDESVKSAMSDAINVMLEDLQHPLMEPSTRNTYDVRVWGHIYALDFFCRLKQSGKFGDEVTQVEPWIEKLTEFLVIEQIDDGGWNYASQRYHAAFVTAPAIQALLWAKSCGMEIEDEVFANAKQALLDSRTREGAFVYSGSASTRPDTQWPGAIARAAVSEMTLMLMGEERESEVRVAIDMFHEHWDELEKRRQKTGTHEPPYGVAPYYFYYGHRYLSQSIRMLPETDQGSEMDRYVEVLMKTKEEDDTWNDRVFDRSKAYGTAMALLSLCPDRVAMPPALDE